MSEKFPQQEQSSENKEQPIVPELQLEKIDDKKEESIDAAVESTKHFLADLALTSTKEMVAQQIDQEFDKLQEAGAEINKASFEQEVFSRIPLERKIEYAIDEAQSSLVSQAEGKKGAEFMSLIQGAYEGLPQEIAFGEVTIAAGEDVDIEEEVAKAMQGYSFNDFYKGVYDKLKAAGNQVMMAELSEINPGGGASVRAA